MISALSNSLSSLGIGRTQAPTLTPPTAGAANAAPATGFADAMAEVASDAARSLRSAETVSIGGINGQMTTQAVAEAVMNAERTLQTAVAVRDKAVAAYLELSRMSI